LTAQGKAYKKIAMSKAQPKTKAEELLGKILALSLEERKNELTLKRLTKAAQALASVDPADSYVCQGTISFYDNKPDDARQYFAKAIKLSHRDSIPVYNFAIMLADMGFYNEHLQYADTAYKLNKTDPVFLVAALRANIVNGKFDTARELLLSASKLRLNSDRITMLNNILQFIQGNSISPSDFVKLQDTAYDLLHSQKIFIMKPTLEILEDEDSIFLSYEILLDKPVMEIVDLSVMLAEALAREPSLNDISGKINISFSPWCD
jgi:tetratricopeptide (TPR) repeat protein